MSADRRCAYALCGKPIAEDRQESAVFCDRNCSRMAKLPHRTRACAICGKDITRSNGKSRYCRPCGSVRLDERAAIQKAAQNAGAVPKDRPCVGCGVDISFRNGNAKFCFLCCASRLRGSAAQRNAAASTRERRCSECQCDIRGRDYRAVMCRPCGARKRREQKAWCIKGVVSTERPSVRLVATDSDGIVAEWVRHLAGRGWDALEIAERTGMALAAVLAEMGRGATQPIGDVRSSNGGPFLAIPAPFPQKAATNENILLKAAIVFPVKLGEA